LSLNSGEVILGILGTVHLFYTFFTDNFDPRDQDTKIGMNKSLLRLTRKTTVWRAWVGFNTSHSFGIIFVAGIYIPLALFHMELILESLWFSVLPFVIGVSYLYLAKQYWFNVPFWGTLMATACFGASALLIHL